MSLFWIYDVPNWLLAVLFMVLFVVASAAGLLATRRWVHRLFGPPPGANEVISYYLGAFGVFYGLTLGLIAVATWQNYADLDRLVADEAAMMRVLDKTVNWYPQPARGEMHARLLDYVTHVIEVEWPAQRQGVALESGMERLLAFERPLATFEPATEGQSVVHAETLRVYAGYIELRRQRMFSVVSSGLPAVVWFVLLMGAVMSIALTFLFSMRGVRGHLLLTTILGGFVGLLIFLIVAMDNPFRGEFSVGPDAFQVVRDVMRLRAG